MAVLTFDDVTTILDDGAEQIYSMMELSVKLRASLKSEKIITTDVADKLNVAALTPMEKIELLLTSIKQRGVPCFVTFCRILNEKGHSHILPVLGVTIDGKTLTVRTPAGQLVAMPVDGTPAANPAGPASTSTPLAANVNPVGSASASDSLAGFPSSRDLDTLFKKKLKVFKKLSLDAAFMIDLISEDIITDGMGQNVEAKPTDSEKVHELMVRQLPKRPHKSKILFLKALLESDQEHLLKEIGITPVQIERLRNVE